MMRRGEHDRRILQIHQDHVGAAGLQCADAFGNLLLETLGASAPGDVVGPKLPYDEIGLEGKNIAAEAGDAARDGFADPAAIDDLDTRGWAQPGEAAPHDLR